MTTDSRIEQRLTAVEHAVSELQRQFATVPAIANWLEQIAGSFKDAPSFEEVLEFGRAIRSADRPSDETGEEA